MHVHVVDNNDLSTLRSQCERVSGETHSTGWAWLQDDYLAYGWKPCYRLVSAAGILLATVAFAFGLGGILGAPLIGWTVVLVSTAGAVAAYWYVHVANFPRFVVFDCGRGLVHVPHILGSGHDAVRWPDANVCIMSEHTESLCFRPTTALYVIRPGWELRRNGNPPLRARIEIDRVGARLHEGHAEAVWRFIVAFMTRPRDANPHLRQAEDNQRAVRDLEFAGSWEAMRLARGSHWKFYGAFARLNLATLTDTPDWLRRPDGSWRPASAGEQTRRS